MDQQKNLRQRVAVRDTIVIVVWLSTLMYVNYKRSSVVLVFYCYPQGLIEE